MRFEWDPDKAAHNFAKHGVELEEAKTVFQDALFITFEDPDHSEGEERLIMEAAASGVPGSALP